MFESIMDRVLRRSDEYLAARSQKRTMKALKALKQMADENAAVTAQACEAIDQFNAMLGIVKIKTEFIESIPVADALGLPVDILRAKLIHQAQAEGYVPAAYGWNGAPVVEIRGVFEIDDDSGDEV